VLSGGCTRGGEKRKKKREKKRRGEEEDQIMRKEAVDMGHAGFWNEMKVGVFITGHRR